MKKMLFYVTNTVICALYLNIRFLFLLFGDASKLESGKLILVNVITAVIGTIMFINIVLSFIECKKKDEK